MKKNKLSYDAYFIHSNSKILPVKFRHIVSILDSPRTFGVDKKEIVEQYIKNGETVGSEGKTRNSIILDLLKKDFVRIRYWARNALWRIQIFETLDGNEKLQKNILKFCKGLKDGSIRDLLQRSNSYHVAVHDTKEQSLFAGPVSEAIEFLSTK